MNEQAVLLVENDPGLRSRLADALERRGCAVFPAESLAQARTRLSENAVDALIVDTLMPDGIGMRLIRELRDDGGRQAVIFMSSVWLDQATIDWLVHDLGVSQVLNKPFSDEALLDAVETALVGQVREVMKTKETRPATKNPPPIPSTTAAEPPTPPRATECGVQGQLQRLRQLVGQAPRAVDASHQIERIHRQTKQLSDQVESSGYKEVRAAVGMIDATLRQMMEKRIDRRELSAWRQIDAALARAELGDTGVGARQVSKKPPVPHSASVLVVEADPDTLSQIQRVGREELIQLHVAQSVGDAMEIARLHQLDGAIIGLSRDAAARGLDAVHRLHQHSARLQVVVIGHEDTFACRVAAMQAGACHFLSKPLNDETLRAVADRFVFATYRPRPRVLIVGRGTGSGKLVELLNNEPCLVRCAEEAEEILTLADQFGPDAILIEEATDALSQSEVCRLLRTCCRWQTTPVMICGEPEQAALCNALEVGADDYINKPVDSRELLARLLRRIEGRFSAPSAAGRDAVTGLLSRPTFLRAMERRLAENRRRARPIALALVDLEDCGGPFAEHTTNDRLLANLGGLLDRRFRTEDLRGRWGEAAFVVAFNGEGPDRAERILSRALLEFGQTLFENGDGRFFSPKFRAGIAVFPDDGATTGELIRKADQRLETARLRGDPIVTLENAARN